MVWTRPVASSCAQTSMSVAKDHAGHGERARTVAAAREPLARLSRERSLPSLVDAHDRDEGNQRRATGNGPRARPVADHELGIRAYGRDSDSLDRCSELTYERLSPINGVLPAEV
jgi:hypothetical protein